MENKIISLASRVREKANKLISHELARQGVTGIVPSHGDILFLLFSAEKLPMKDIAEKIQRTKPTVTVLVEKLVSLGFLEKKKSQEDARVTFIKLSDEGQKLKPIFDSVSENVNTLICKDLSVEDVRLAESLLAKINRNLDS